jgi:hypothetical protein
MIAAAYTGWEWENACSKEVKTGFPMVAITALPARIEGQY